MPFTEVTPSSRTRGFSELSERIREEGVLAPAACDRVVANLIAQARAKRSVDWLAERAFGDKAWANARDGIDPSARPAKPAAGRPEQPSMPTPPKFERAAPPPAISAEDRAAMLAQAAAAAAAPERGREIASMPTHELVKRFGDGQRAPPSAAQTSPDPDEKSLRKAAK